MSAPRGPYAGVRVLDLSRVLAGPYATLVLGDLGAEVIKIESPHGGDDARHFLPPERDGVSAYFLSVNRNKKSVVIDLKAPGARELFLRLAAEADVVVENFRTGVVERLGIDYPAVRSVNPGIIYCSISGYGRTGSHAQVPGYDPTAQAESGLMSMSGDPHGPATRIGVSLVDMVAGLFAAQSISAALLHRRDSARGQHLEVSLFDTALNMLVNAGATYLVTGENPTRAGSGSQVARPSGLFRAADRELMITVASDQMFARLCREVLERSDLAEDPAFATNPQRIRNWPALETALQETFATRTLAQWMTRLRDAGVPAAAINTVAEALEAPLVDERGLIRPAPHSTLGPVPTLVSPMRLGLTPTVDPVAAPVLGEHTASVLTDVLGLDPERIAQLTSSGVVSDGVRHG